MILDPIARAWRMGLGYVYLGYCMCDSRNMDYIQGEIPAAGATRTGRLELGRPLGALRERRPTSRFERLTSNPPALPGDTYFATGGRHHTFLHDQ